MTSSDIRRFDFSEKVLRDLAATPRFQNWPVVYALDNRREVYVGESLSLARRMRQHLKSGTKGALDRAHVVVRDDFNKSACLDLESHLIQWFHAEGTLKVTNLNGGIVDAAYFDRDTYRTDFPAIFDELLSAITPRQRATRPCSAADLVAEVENSELFKLSPFKSLNREQAVAVEHILDGLAADLASGRPSTSVVQGEPGTGKTVLAVFLMKLLRDIQDPPVQLSPDQESPFAEYFAEGNPELFGKLGRIGIVVPQQALRKSVKEVFRKTPGLHKSMVLSPFQVGTSVEPYDLLIVDEAHRLSRRANQGAGQLNKQFPEINQRLFGNDDLTLTQLDWILRNSHHQILLIDTAQRVRPSDVPVVRLRSLVDQARRDRRLFPLESQMRVKGGADYIGYVRSLLNPTGSSLPREREFDGYDLRFFTDLEAMQAEIRRRDDEVGLSRLVAGFAWPWETNRARKRREDISSVYDIELDGVSLRWNSSAVDWVSQARLRDEVGSIHTVQGYDLNYAAVIVGPDLRFDPATGRLVFDRSNYFDTRGMANNAQLSESYSDEDLLEYITNIYAVLLTRGIRGTYVYICDPALRQHLGRFFSPAD